MAVPLGGRGAPHRPVLLRETIELLAAERGGLFVDCTVGLGGHSEAILQASSATQVLALDRDDEALELARERLALYGSRFRAVHADFRELTRVLAKAKIKQARGILADLGVSSWQLGHQLPILALVTTRLWAADEGCSAGASALGCRDRSTQTVR